MTKDTKIADIDVVTPTIIDLNITTNINIIIILIQSIIIVVI